MNNQINQLFNLLDKWRNFPAYQLERRADIFFALYLPDILAYKFNHIADFLIPEFPVRRGSIYNDGKSDNKSVKVDYLSYDTNKNEAYLIELKTDMNSRRDSQDDYLQKTLQLKPQGLTDGIIAIEKATKQRNKYRYLVEELMQMEWIQQQGNVLQNKCDCEDLKLAYIQPQNPEQQENIISFSDIIEVLETKTDDLSKRFAESLEEWRAETNLKT